MVRKIVILALVAVFAALGADAMSQNPGSGSITTPDKATSPEKSFDSGPQVRKAEVGGQKSEVGSPKSELEKKSTPTGTSTSAKDASAKDMAAKSETGFKGKDSPTSKETPTGKEKSSSKTFPTSSSASLLPSAGRRELVIEHCVVTIFDDNKVPASEPGMLTNILVKEGQSVEKGDMVAEIDTRSTLAKQKIAAAEQEAAEAQAANDAEVEVANRAIDVSQADLEMTDQIRKRSPAAVPEAEYRKVKFTLDKSKAQLKQATNEKEIARLTASAKQAQYEAATIEIDLRQARAPFSGLVVEVMKNVGDWLTIGEPIMHIVGLDKVKVKGFVLVSGEDGASHDEVIGKPVTITVDGPGGKKHTVKGVVDFASPVIEGAGSSRQFRIWAEVNNEKTVDPVTKRESWKIQPGSMATMTIDLTPPRPAPAPVPSKTDSSKGVKSKVDAFKPVTTGTEKADEKKTTKRER